MEYKEMAISRKLVAQSWHKTGIHSCLHPRSKLYLKEPPEWHGIDQWFRMVKVFADCILIFVFVLQILTDSVAQPLIAQDS